MCTSSIFSLTTPKIKAVLYPILKGTAVDILTELFKDFPQLKKVVATLLNPTEVKKAKSKRNRHQWPPGVFVGSIHTSDVIGDPEHKIGHVSVYTNGGRLQPGCYENEKNLTQRDDRKNRI